MAEILSPCGSPEAVTAALGCGCDAIYVGSKAFSARQNATNFTDEELAEAVKECHRNGVKVYQAINTVYFDSQRQDVINELSSACKIGIDGIITQDLGLIVLAKSVCPDMPIHASTQMTIHTKNGVELCKELGFSRVVVSRELSLEAIKELCKTDIEIEAFVHGALCMSVSGQCYMSAMIGSRSANRGLCAQACRLPACAEPQIKEERYDLSLKDMSHVSFLKEIEAAGVTSFKIEGRMKRLEYVAAATDACRKALDGQAFDIEMLKAVFSRSGFTDGYLTCKLGSQMFGTRVKDDVTSASDVLPKLHELYRKPFKRFHVRFEIEIIKDKPVSLKAYSSDGITTEALGENPQIALNRPITEEIVSKQLSKLGSTIYELESMKCNINDGITIPASALNELRRTACESLDEKRINKLSAPKSTASLTQASSHTRTSCKQSLRIELSKASQLDGFDTANIEYIILPISEFDDRKAYDYSKLSLSLPRFDFNENKTAEKLSNAVSCGLKHIHATNLSHIVTARNLGLNVHGDFGLNVTNSDSIKLLNDLSLCDITASFELKAKQLESLQSDIPLGVIAYGRLPLMLTVNCPIKQSVGCKGCTHSITDRTGRIMPVKCSKDYVEILNSDILYLADRLNDFNTMDFLTLKFYEETPEQINEIIRAYRSGKQSTIPLTRALYYRGIL